MSARPRADLKRLLCRASGLLARLALLLSAVAVATVPSLVLPSAAPARRKPATVAPAAAAAAATTTTTTTTGGETATAPGETPPSPPQQSGSGTKSEAQGQPEGGAGGERHSGRLGACEVQIEVAPRHLTAGESAALSGSVTCPSASQVVEQTVTVLRHSVGTPGTSVVGTATPEASGAFHLTTEALDGDSVFYAHVQGDRRARASVQVAPLVTIAATPTATQLSIGAHQSAASPSAGGTVTFSGTVTPNEVGRRVVLERKGANVEGGWHPVAVGTVGAEGKYSITHTFGIPGDASVRVIVPANRTLLAGVSESLTYQIARRPKPTADRPAQRLPRGES